MPAVGHLGCTLELDATLLAPSAAKEMAKVIEEVVSHQTHQPKEDSRKDDGQNEKCEGPWSGLEDLIQL